MIDLETGVRLEQNTNKNTKILVSIGLLFLGFNLQYCDCKYDVLEAAIEFKI